MAVVGGERQEEEVQTDRIPADPGHLQRVPKLCGFIYWCLCFSEIFATELRIYLDVTLGLALLSLSQPPPLALPPPPHPDTHTHTHTHTHLRTYKWSLKSSIHITHYTYMGEFPLIYIPIKLQISS